MKDIRKYWNKMLENEEFRKYARKKKITNEDHIEMEKLIKKLLI